MDFWHDAAAQKRWLRRFALLTGVLLLPVLVLAVFARPSACLLYTSDAADE